MNDVPAIARFKQSTNSDSIIRFVNKQNVLYFNLSCPAARFPFNRTLTIPWELEYAKSGVYNINVLVDFNEAIFEVRLNDTVLGKVWHDEDAEVVYTTDREGGVRVERNTQFFKKGVNTLNTSLSHSFYVGTVGKSYNTTLNDILENGSLGDDPYACKNTSVSNLKVFTKHLSLHEYQAMRLEDKNINPLVLTLPTNFRQGTDEMVRFFRYNSNPAVSNAVRINVSGTTLASTSELEALKNEIVDELADKTDALVEIRNINIVD